MGTPPSGVFVGKPTTATAAWDSGAPTLTVALLATTVLSLFHYLRWIAPAFGVSAEGGTARRRALGHAGSWSSGVAVVAAALSLVTRLGAGLMWDVVSRPMVP